MARLVSLIKSVSWAALIIWGGLSLLVLFFLVDRWMHPDMKGISKRDLLTYRELSFWLIGVFGFSRVIHYVTKRRPGK